MKNTVLFLVLILAVVLSSCTKEPVVVPNKYCLEVFSNSGSFEFNYADTLFNMHFCEDTSFTHFEQTWYYTGKCKVVAEVFNAELYTSIAIKLSRNDTVIMHLYSREPYAQLAINDYY